MSRRLLLGVALLAALAANTASGVARMIAFHHRHAGELSLANGELDEAFAHLTAARRWQPDDGLTYVLLGRVISLAQANGLPLEALEGHHPQDVFALGVAAVSRGIALNPADAWGWFNLVEAYQSARSARVRLEAMKSAGEAARQGRPAGDVARPRTAQAGLEPEDRLGAAATLQALELEPDFYFYRDFLAKFYWARGLKSEAAAEIRQSLAQWPRVEAHAALQDDALVRGLSDAILEGLEASSANRFAGPVMAARGKAAVLERLGRPAEAIEAFQALRKAGDPSVAGECDVQIGRLELENGRAAESLASLERVLEEAPKSSQANWALYFLGLAHATLGDREKSISFLRRHLEREPDSQPGLQALADQEESAGRSAEAERLLISAVIKHPSEPQNYLRVIAQMRKHGKARQALSYAEALRKVSPELEGTEDLIRQLEAEAAPKRP